MFGTICFPFIFLFFFSGCCRFIGIAKWGMFRFLRFETLSRNKGRGKESSQNIAAFRSRVEFARDATHCATQKLPVTVWKMKLRERERERNERWGKRKALGFLPVLRRKFIGLYENAGMVFKVSFVSATMLLTCARFEKGQISGIPGYIAIPLCGKQTRPIGICRKSEHMKGMPALPRYLLTYLALSRTLHLLFLLLPFLSLHAFPPRELQPPFNTLFF